MTPDLLSQVLADRLPNNNDSTIDGAEARVLFQLLRLADPSTSLAWHSIWHGLEKTPSPTPC